MKKLLASVGVILALGAWGCGETPAGAGGAGGAGGSAGGGGGGAGGGAGAGASGAAGGTGGAASGGAGGGVPATAAELLALTSSCQKLPGTTDFATDQGEPDTVSLCQLVGAVFWKADLDVDCDGGQAPACMADPSYLPDTSATDSQGNPLDASTLPFFVIPLPSNGFDSSTHGIELGSVGAILYNGQVQYGIFGDEGPKGIIGEASYAMASLLGIDPDPSTGGADSGATYIVFSGPTGVVSKNEEHAEAVAVGEARAAELLQTN